MGDDNNFDLYGDLDLDEVLNESIKKEEQAKIVKKSTENNLAVEELQNRIKILEKELCDEISKNKRLENNMSALLLTCKAEIERKDLQIHELNKRYDEIIFRKFKPNNFKAAQTFKNQQYHNPLTIDTRVVENHHQQQKPKVNSDVNSERNHKKSSSSADEKYSKEKEKDSRDKKYSNHNSRSNEDGRGQRDSSRQNRHQSSSRKRSRSPRKDSHSSSDKRRKYSKDEHDRESSKSRHSKKDVDLREKLLKGRISKEYEKHKLEPKEKFEDFPVESKNSTVTPVEDGDKIKKAENNENKDVPKEVQVEGKNEQEIVVTENFGDEVKIPKENKKSSELEEGEIEENSSPVVENVNKVEIPSENSTKEMEPKINGTPVKKSTKPEKSNKKSEKVVNGHASPLREKLPRRSKEIVKSILSEEIPKKSEIDIPANQQMEKNENSNQKVVSPDSTQILQSPPKVMEIESKIITPEKNLNGIQSQKTSPENTSASKRRSYTKEINEEGIAVVTIVRHKKKKKKKD